MSQPNDQNATDRREDLDSLGQHDRNRLRDLNQEMLPLVNALIHSQIETRAERHPLNEAVCAWNGTLTCEELNQRANTLASSLIAAGVQVGDYVPLLFEKSKWYIVSILAVHKAGAAFVPLEQTMPEGRIQIILEQLDRLPLILASTSQSGKFETSKHRVIVVNDESTSPSRDGGELPVEKPKRDIKPGSPAYVIFTSGTTGTPKGAVIPHGQLCTTMNGLNERIGLNTGMRTFQMTACNFDFSIFEIFCPLVAGGCVCIPSETDRLDDVAGAVDRLNANTGSFSPSYLARLAEHDFPKLKTILLAGEKVTADLSDFWIAHGRRVIHLFGPSECTVCCCFLDANSQGHYDGFIGDPLGCRMWIVDSENHDKILPIGATGEILIEGPIVGAGYLRNKDKTKESFIEAPAWFEKILDRQPSRFYKTGDLGRQTEEGHFDMVGRKDTQTKIRGIRVEVQEVEHKIREVYSADVGIVVEVRNPNSIPGQQMLVAFIETENNTGIDYDSSKEIRLEELKKPIDQSFSEAMQQVESKLRQLDRKALKETANELKEADIQDIARSEKQTE
ncbi:hypothetical protein JMJ35_007527 [Cladonia borealis]|uniref:AMP-dependent synthetase/ligase domain-containing protein n=1 Tax=Cladonia borealis TaxID=184061 RepID=A0AA39UZN4_9LECA|nr:hypothetical protein JMJ35_007527 [Cladonia borealis]